jgi:phosphatidylglycerophosphatase A
LYLLLPYQQPQLYLVLSLLFIAAAIWLAHKAEVIFDAKDSRRIVIDEIVGFLLAMFLLPPSWGYILAAFFIYRAFDVVKPPPTRRLENLPGGFGVVLDDVMAGIYTNLVLQVWQLIVRLWG